MHSLGEEEQVVGTAFQGDTTASERDSDGSEQPGGHGGWRVGSRGQEMGGGEKARLEARPEWTLPGLVTFPHKCPPPSPSSPS